jgi:alpha-methylacyl-CoA racemase
MGPLSGVVILDFSTLLPGPLATLLMAEAGARVVKIERPITGEDMRGYEPAWGDYSATFALLNRGKESLEVDLKHPGAWEVMRSLIDRADILVEQFRPGVMDRLGFGYEAVARVNPRIIYCSISAYGQSGPKRDAVGHDINLLAETGLLTLATPETGEPVMPPTPIGDIAGGSYPAVINILLALRERDQTGQGRHLDIALGDNLFTLAYWALADGWAGKGYPGNRDRLVTGASPRYRLYSTRDAQIVAAAPIEQKFWTNFCELIGLEQSLRDDSLDPGATAARVAEIIASEDASTWKERFAKCECCCSVAVDLKDAVQDPHFQARGLFAHRVLNERGNSIPALPVPIDDVFRATPDRAAMAPSLGDFDVHSLG